MDEEERRRVGSRGVVRAAEEEGRTGSRAEGRVWDIA